MFLKKQVLIFTCLLLSLCLINCSKSSSKCYWQSPPPSLFFLLKKSGNRLADSILNNLKLSYLESGTKKYVPDLKRATEDGYALGIMASRKIGILSADNHIKEFTVEYPDGSSDTLHVDFESPSPANGCYYNLKQVKYNNQLSYPDPTITIQRIYLFEKP